MKWLIPLFLLLTTICFGQKSFDRGEYDVFIAKTNRDARANDAETNYKLGEAYRRSNRIQESIPYYAAAIKDGGVDESAYVYYARALRADQQLDKARSVLNDFVLKGRNSEFIKLAEAELKALDKIDEIKEKTSYYRVKNLTEINTPDAEYSPVFNNNFLYFTTNRHSNKTYRATGTGYTDLYRIGSRGANVNLQTLKAMPEIINDPNVNEGSITLSADGSFIVFAKGNTGKASGNNNVNLFYSRFRNGSWLEPRALSVNDPDSWDSTPSLSPDGLTLYWSSNRPGGYGGDDLYAANLDRRGRWVDVRNLGPEINTPGNENFPYVSEDGKLYFSSDGHPGFGRLDLFVANRTGGKVEIENLGAPMNSEGDDFGIFLFDLTKGFFSSNRKGGKGDDDIYTFINEDPDLKVVNYFLTGITFTKDDGDKDIILPHTKVRLLDASDNLIGESFTGEDGKFSFRVYPEETYYVIGEKTDYFTTRKIFSTIGKSVDKSTLTEFITNVNFETDLQMDRIVIEKTIVLNNIYYDLDKADIRTDAMPTLDSLVMIMNDNPDIYIELGSHTDNRADDNYNLDLSRRRAISAVRYIISKGIDDARISARGYGESRLIIANAKTEEEHQVNRRTEFKVLQYNPKNREDNIPVAEEVDEYDRFFIDDGSGG
jgi:outer membrane protein OmpA-like peptidoglycan-associated protein/Tol biopolymer transport system component